MVNNTRRKRKAPRPPTPDHVITTRQLEARIDSLPQEPSPAHEMTTEQLKARIEDLPQELYDEIKSLALTFNINTTETIPALECRHTRVIYVIRIDKDYQPPPQLQVSSAIRAEFSARYYSANHVSGHVFFFSDVHVMQKWLRSLSESALGCLTKANLCFAKYAAFGYHYPEGEIRDPYVFDEWIAGVHKVRDLRKWFAEKQGIRTRRREGCLKIGNPISGLVEMDSINHLFR